MLHADASVLVVEKPPGLLTVPGRGHDKQDCLSTRMQRCYADALVVHRLDMATSGVMLMARGKAAQRALSQAFANRLVNKKYEAVVRGDLAGGPDGWAVIDLPLAVDWPNRPRRIVTAEGGKPSFTRWRVLARTPDGNTRVELEPLTGRSHQLRVHLLAIGHPIIGDRLYDDSAQQGARSERLLLHATQIEFTHPVTLGRMRFASVPAF